MAKMEKTYKEQQDPKLEALFEAANRDPELKKRLLAKPREVAAEWNVELGDQDVEQLEQLGVIVALADDVRFGRLYQPVDPRIFYPVSVWKIKEVLDIVRHIIPGGGVTYPGPEGFRFVPGAASKFKIPNIIFYPPDDWPGGWGRRGGGGGGIVFDPGVIFYPADLLSHIQARLVQVLRTTGKLQE